MWCIPAVDTEFVARMEDVLDLYAELPNRRRPVICFDERPVQLLSDTAPDFTPYYERLKQLPTLESVESTPEDRIIL